MKSITKSAIVALLTATVGLSAIAPGFAQDAAPTQTAEARPQGGNGPDFRHGNNGPRQGGGFGGDIIGLDRGAEAVEVALVRLSHRIDLTAAQQPLFDTFRTAALAAADDLATATEGLRPIPATEGETATAPDISARLENRIAIETARLAALKAVQPSAAAFFDSLTAEQLAQLTPQRPDRNGAPGGFGKGGPRHQDQQEGGPAPADAPAPPPANG